MKRKIVICIIVIIAFFILVQAATKESPSRNYPVEPKPAESSQQEEPSIEISEYEENYQFMLLDDDGKVTVYYSDNLTVYLDTGISTASLPAELQEQLFFGIRFETEMELYEFLENYSS